MNHKVPCSVTNAKVVLCHAGFGRIKGHLVASEPALVTNDSGSVDKRSTKIKVDISVNGHGVVFELSLNLAVLGASAGGEGGVEGQLQSLADLILNIDDGRQVVVGVPLLGQG